jgi:hypothetical protein
MIMTQSSVDFLEHYQRDVPIRWSADDLAAQRQFVNGALPAGDWLDWSTPQVSLHLLQSELLSTPMGVSGEYSAVVLAGPAVELLQLENLLRSACRCLTTAGRIIGIVPCLRDNSPESAEFMRISEEVLWPYSTADEIQESLRETGLAVLSEASRFVPVPTFVDAALHDRMHFKGFRDICRKIQALGYDAGEVGWGEFRFIAVG